MGELEDKLSGILNNPGQMEKLMTIARSFIGDKETSAAEENTRMETSYSEEAEPASWDEDYLPSEPTSRHSYRREGSSDMIQSLMGGLSKGNYGKSSLLGAITPYLREERQSQLKRAMSLAKVAKIVFSDLGGGER